VPLDSMNCHQSWKAPLSVGIEQSMREFGPFIDLNDGEGSAWSTRIRRKRTRRIIVVHPRRRAVV
jgi:hypothetical protein